MCYRTRNFEPNYRENTMQTRIVIITCVNVYENIRKINNHFGAIMKNLFNGILKILGKSSQNTGLTHHHLHLHLHHHFHYYPPSTDYNQKQIEHDEVTDDE